MPNEKRRAKKTSAVAGARRTRARSPQARARTERGGKIRARPRPRRDAARALGDIRTKSPLVRLLEAIEAEQVEYALIGMSAAIAQGVMANTIDVDIWINLPPRQYMRMQNLARKLGATPAANTVVYLEDGTPVNFVYEVTGLAPFTKEKQHITKAHFHSHDVPVLRLERILKSKEAIQRDKDKLHIVLIREFLRCQRGLKRTGK